MLRHNLLSAHPYPMHSGMRLYRQPREFQRAKMRINAPQILKIRCKGNNFYANQHYFTTIISLSDSGVCPKTHCRRALQRCRPPLSGTALRCIPLQSTSPRRSPGLTENVSALRTSSLTSFRYALPPHSVVHVYDIGDAGANLPSA